MPKHVFVCKCVVWLNVKYVKCEFEKDLEVFLNIFIKVITYIKPNLKI